MSAVSTAALSWTVLPTAFCSVVGVIELITGAFEPQMLTWKTWSKAGDERPVESVATRRTVYVPATSATKLGDPAVALFRVALLAAG